MNPALIAFLKGAINIVPGIINTVTSIVKDKKTGKDDNPDSLLIPPAGSVPEMIATGMSVSSKRLINVCGTGTMFAISVQEYFANGLSWPLVGLFSVGALFSLAMAWITKQSEQ